MLQWTQLCLELLANNVAMDASMLGVVGQQCYNGCNYVGSCWPTMLQWTQLCWEMLANNVAMDATLLRVVGQQCCVRLHAAKSNSFFRFSVTGLTF